LPTSFKLSKEALASLGSMEGSVYLPAVERRPAEPRLKLAPKPLLPGWLTSIGVASLAYAIHYLPFAPFRVGDRRPISAAILAILVGALAANFLPLGIGILHGAKDAVRRSIPLTIVLTGASLSVANATAVGWRAFAIIVVTMAAAMASAWMFGRMLKLSSGTSVLIGAGTAICGNSAIIAVAPLIDADDRDVMLSVGAINVLGLALMFVSPFAGGIFGMSDQAYGVWAGTTIHAVPQAVAAGFAFSEKAGGLATLVKLVRVALLAPLLLILAFTYARSRKDRLKVHYSRLIPPFLWGFLALFALNSLGFLPVLQFQSGYSVGSAGILTEVSNLLLTLSMAALGLEVNLRVLAKAGGAAMAAGTPTCIATCAVSYLLIRALL
jgi:uncharacterized integral membrane protein (TIGR00698 family)